MRILHTSDWHLGRMLKGASLEDDQQLLLDQVLDTLITQNVDVLIIAGDIYDRALPSAATVSLFRQFLERFARETDAALVAIAGNHDSGDRIGAFEAVSDQTRFLIRGPLQSDERTLTLSDEHGDVVFSALPYGEINQARAIFDDQTINTPEDVLKAEVDAARRHIPETARWVIAAHAFVAGGATSEGERELISVGGIQTVSPSIFDGAAYVALGHLHRAQTAGSEHIRYCGAPMAFGFDEADTQKSMTLIELGPETVESISQIPFTPLRQMRIIRGPLAELESKAETIPSMDFIKAILTDEGEVIDPLSRLRKYYPNTLTIARETRHERQHAAQGRANANLAKPKDVVAEFVAYVRGALSEDETTILDTALSGIDANPAEGAAQ